MSQLLEHCKHEWNYTGKHGVHVEFPTIHNGRRQLYAYYMQCSKCGQLGFKRKWGEKLIFTWTNTAETKI